MEPYKFDYQSMGCQWQITIWDLVPQVQLTQIQTTIVKLSQEFDQTYSRFKPDSLVSKLATQSGIFDVPKDLVEMLRLYQSLNIATAGKLNPLIGNTLSDLGYNAQYSLTEQQTIRPTPDFNQTIKIINDTQIEISQPVLIDLGALGKGYFVDKIKNFLLKLGLRRFLVDGSGDVYYSGAGLPITIGLEHPTEPNKIIGTIELVKGALCGSGTNRRRWRTHHHIIDPQINDSQDGISAAWVIADNAALADGLATSLFLVAPDKLSDKYKFEFCILNSNLQVTVSKNFNAQLF
jgi:thiamine biosynthesis lipoprotein